MYQPTSFEQFYSLFFDFNVDLFSFIRTNLKKSPSKILDIACGTGVSTRAISKVFECPVLGLDNSESLITHARSLFMPKGVAYKIESITAHETKWDKYDIVFLKSAFHLLCDLLDPHEIASRIGKNNFLCIIEKTSRSFDSQLTPVTFNKNTPTAFEFFKKLINQEKLEIKTFSYGTHVSVDKDSYLNGVEKKQLSYLWQQSECDLVNWLKNNKSEAKYIRVFEEFDITILYNPSI